MANDTLWDRIARKLYPRYLAVGETGKINGKIYAGIMRRSVDVQNKDWKIVHYVYLNSDSLLKYMGLARKLNLGGEINQNQSIFEIVKPVLEKDLRSTLSVNNGDTVCVAPSDRQYIYPYLNR